MKTITPVILEGTAYERGSQYGKLLGSQVVESVSYQSSGAGERCSTIGTDRTEMQPTLVAQNLGHLVIYDGLQCLLRFKYPDPPLECYILSFAGLLAVNGMNSLGVGIVCNARHKYLDNRGDGLPVTFVLRGILEQPNLERARAFLRTVRHASGQSHILDDLRAAACFECSANQVAPFSPTGVHGRVYHTNHPLFSTDLRCPAKPGPDAGTTFDRLEYLEARLADPHKAVDVDTLALIPAMAVFIGTLALWKWYGLTPEKMKQIHRKNCRSAALA